MRQRECLEDFRGGHVACRDCKRLLFFDPEELATAQPRICCGIAYVPQRRQLDLYIFDRLDSDSFPDGIYLPPVGAVDIPADEQAGEVLIDDEPPDQVAESAELGDLVVNAATAEARRASGVSRPARRGPQYG